MKKKKHQLEAAGTKTSIKVYAVSIATDAKLMPGCRISEQQ